MKALCRWYSEAAREKDSLYLYTVGKCLIEGIITERNVREGVKYLEEGYAAGSDPALSTLAYYYQDGIGVVVNTKKALALYKRAAEGFTFCNLYKEGSCQLLQSHTSLVYISGRMGGLF